MAYSIAQSFLVDVEGGAFATRCDIYFSAKDTQFPITMEIVEVTNGQPTRTVVPFSRVTLSPDEVYISNDASKPTPFWFESPVYLQGDTEYAIVLSPGADSPNYNVWTARLGDVEIGTDNLISKQAAVGVLFASTDGRTYTPYQEYDLKFQMKSCRFDESGTIIFVNDDADYLTVANTTGQFSIGETVYGNTVSNPSSISDFSSSSGSGFFKYYIDGDQSKPVLTAMSSALSVGQVIKGLSSNTEATIVSIDDITVDSSFIKTEFLSLTGTRETTTIRNHDEAGNLDSVEKSIDLNETVNYLEPKKIYSFSNEQTLISGRKSSKVKLALETDYENLSSAFDDDNFSAFKISNQVNFLTTNEENSDGGDALARYITRTVTLEEGQDAEDIVVYFDAYKPQGTDVKAYYKILNSSDSDDFADKSWFAMEQETDVSTFSVRQNFDDLKEYKFVIPTSNKTGAFGEVVYTNSAGAQFTGFITFAIKLVLIASSTADVPRVQNFRAIALQV